MLGTDDRYYELMVLKRAGISREDLFKKALAFLKTSVIVEVWSGGS